VGILGVSSLFARAVLLPAFAVIAVFEFWRLRDWLSHALAGGLLALADGHPADWQQVSPMQPARRSIQPGWDIAIHSCLRHHRRHALLALAGRNAGRWLPSERAKAQRCPDIEADQRLWVSRILTANTENTAAKT
jgi:hypothetical protein